MRSTGACCFRRSAARRRSRPSSPDPRGARRSRSACPRRCDASADRPCASACCSSCRSAARRRRAPSSRSARSECRHHAAPRTASTSAAGSRAAASTSSSTAATGGSSAGAAGSAASPTAPRACRARDRPGLEGERRARARGDRAGRGRGADRGAPGRLQGLGLYHLLAVSGQNITFLALGVLGLAWLLGIPRLAGRGGGDRRDRGYVLAVGWQPSVVRAGVAGGLASLAWLLSRPRDRWHFLALGAAVLLAWTPASLLEPGFQLSFAAVGSIFLLVPRLRLALEGYPLPDWLRDALAVSTACGAATAPILWLQFGSVPVYSLLANVLVTLAIGPLLGIALVGSLIEPVLPSAALALAWLNGWLAAYIAGVRRLDRRLAVRPGRLRGRGRDAARHAARAARAASACRAGGAALLACAAASCPRSSSGSSLPSRGCRRRPGSGSPFLDVGQGDAILVQVPEGAVLVDQGRPEAEVAQQLREPRRAPALGARAHAPAARPHRRRRDVSPAVAVDRVLDPRLAVSGPSSARRSPRPRRARRGGGRDACGRRLPASAGSGSRALARPAGHAGRGPEPAPDRPARDLRRGRRAADRGRGDGRDGAAALAAVEILKVAHHGSADPGLAASCASCRPRSPSSPAAATTTTAIRRRRRWRRSREPGPAPLPHRRGRRVVLESDGRRISVRTDR